MMSEMYNIIAKKRDGGVLSEEEINFFVAAYTKRLIPDHQMSALLMAIYLKGFNAQETLTLTKAMMHSGDVIDLSDVDGIVVDKHSTGGVGDKTTLVLMPLVAAAGVKIAKMTGKSLGHSGGTWDKMLAFKDISLELDHKQFVQNIKDIGVAINGQTTNLVPADKLIYALRGQTATISSIPLIASSIMSKKLAAGSDAIVLDVKVGSGAFIPNIEDAIRLSKQMVNIGEGMGRKTVVVMSRMGQPLGNAVGNILEVKESIEVLRGNGPEDLSKLCFELASWMLILSGKAANHKSAREILEHLIDSGKAIDKLKELVSTQGGDTGGIDDLDNFEKVKYSKDLKSDTDKYIISLNAKTVGEASMLLGAGRHNKETNIDLTAGIYLHKKIGSKVKKGESLATLYSNDESLIEQGYNHLLKAYSFSDTAPSIPSVVIGYVSKEGVQILG